MGRSFIHDDFMLHGSAAQRLFHEFAENEPILDYHCHLPPQDLARNRVFANLFEIWLEGDHYKWRAMRANGIPEDYCTGKADPYEKFLAFAKTVPHALRNPLYHWSHLELKRYFGIDLILSPETAKEIWDEANRQLPELGTHSILEKFKVRAVATTDDPADTLDFHREFSHPSSRVFPTFRPDRAMAVDQPAVFNEWLGRMEAVCGEAILDWPCLIKTLEVRHDFFHQMGGRLSDHGLESLPFAQCSDEDASVIFDKVRNGVSASPSEREAFGALVMRRVGAMNARKGWIMQLHLGALRNNNTRLFKKLGRDVGGDSIGDFSQAEKLSRFLDSLDQEGNLPKTILYNLNPSDYAIFATMIGNFQDGTVPGKMQLGSGWWFLDQKDGMEAQFNALSAQGLLSRFVGMLTDSRSFMSFPRHEYFRRILCNMLGGEMERGELPDDFSAVGGMVRRICYGNAREYFGFDMP